MLGIHDIWLFVLSGLLLNITPGPDTAYIIGRSVQIGWRGGVTAVLGICAGCLVHVLAAAIGLSALLAASSTAFTVVKWVGAAYLLYSGIQMLRWKAPADLLQENREKPAIRLSHVFWQGALTNALNPKVALFFLAFLPQFVDAEAPHKALAFMTLGMMFIGTGMAWCLGVAVFAARAARRVRQSGKALVWINRALGGVFIYLGIRVALLEAR
ncbi:LysE family translocator [Tardiphaga alba]|uniref:LysE family translocator n=1 Tax=Tardiphaga alba TaxID=340268 RepID=A0ABX8AGI5_9BRAD|nr:LysE family translocator [Tardiphaga alba]QUS41704.1 LysE family translocator [Tardiphaga alba]